MELEFKTPYEGNSIIKVVGVGGGGSNAVSSMYNQGIQGVGFIVCNTDLQALENSPIPTRVQLGPHLTNGLGAGGNPEIGRKAAQESLEEIRTLLMDNTRMVFITAGMGGGTGTGSAPVIAKIAKEMGILTVGIVTTPFSFEGPWRMENARQGIAEMSNCVDTLLVINNSNLLKICKGKENMRSVYLQADLVLSNAARGIAEIITMPGFINVDFADVQTIMQDSGTALMGMATHAGEGRAQIAVEEALNSPLLDNMDIQGATGLLVNVTASEDLTMDEVSLIGEYINNAAGGSPRIIFGQAFDNNMDDALSVTIIATGLNEGPSQHRRSAPAPESVGAREAVQETRQTARGREGAREGRRQPDEAPMHSTPQPRRRGEPAPPREENTRPEREASQARPPKQPERSAQPERRTQPQTRKVQTQKKITPEERLERIRQNNLDIRNPSVQQQVEDHPAYDRRGVDLDEPSPQQSISRLSIDTSTHGMLHIKDNTYIFDNVD